MKPIYVIAITVALLATATVVEAQTVGMYPYTVFERRPLAVGTPVWANIGDNRCAYAEQYPSAKDECFEQRSYQEARIVEIFVFRGRADDVRRYAYRVEFERTGANPDRGPQRAAFLDEAYTIYNLLERWAEWSRHFILLNW